MKDSVPDPWPPGYPSSLEELEKWFPNEDACRGYLYSLKWPRGFRCPKCMNTHYWWASKRLECPDCGHQTSVMTDTIFQKTRTPGGGTRKVHHSGIRKVHHLRRVGM